MFKHLGTYTVEELASEVKHKCGSLGEALDKAETLVGTRAYCRLFPNENRFIFGPGDGTTSVIVSEDVEWVQ